MGLQNNILKTILQSNRTVFTVQALSLLSGSSDSRTMTKSLNYYVQKGDLLNPRRGVYAKQGYNPEEMACSILVPSYLSLEYVLQRVGIIFQYSEEITAISYQSRTMDIDNRTYSFRQINPILWTNTIGIEMRDNISIATAERAFLDMMYLTAGNYYFDNLNPLNKTLIKQILPNYSSATLTERVYQLLKL